MCTTGLLLCFIQELMNVEFFETAIERRRDNSIKKIVGAELLFI